MNQSERKGCHPIEIVRQLFGGRGKQDVSPQISTEQSKEDEPHVYQVRITGHGAYVDDVTLGQHFFRTSMGGPEGKGSWFWLAGEGSPFDEDASLPGEVRRTIWDYDASLQPGSQTDHLDSLVNDAQQPPAEEPLALPPSAE